MHTALKVCLHSPCQTPVFAGTTGSPEIPSPLQTRCTICIIPHSAWQGPQQLPRGPLQQFLGGQFSPALFFFFSLPLGDRGVLQLGDTSLHRNLPEGSSSGDIHFFGWQASTTTPPIHFKTYITPNTNVAYTSAGGSFLASCRIKCCQPYSSLRAHLSASSTDMSWYELLEWCHATVKVDFYPFFWTGGWGTLDPGQWYIDQKEVHKFHLDIWQEASEGGLNTAKKAKSCQAV